MTHSFLSSSILPNRIHFSEINLQKNEYTEEDESDFSYVGHELPETKKEIQNIKTISDFVAYEKEHNIRKLVFVYQSNGGDMSNSELVLNVNELTNIIPGVSYSDETYKKTTFGIQEDNFDV